MTRRVMTVVRAAKVVNSIDEMEPAGKNLSFSFFKKLKCVHGSYPLIFMLLGLL